MSSGSNLCPQCGSRRFRRDRSGVIVCEEGHVYQGFRVEETTLAEGEGTRHVLTKRHLRKQRKRRRRRRDVGDVDPNVFQGDEKHYVRLELLQLMLRQLVRCAREEWDLPVSVESYARELWALLLALHPLPPPPVPRSSPASPIIPPTTGARPPFEPKPSRLAFSASQPAPGRHGSRRTRHASTDPEDLALDPEDKEDGSSSDPDKTDSDASDKEEGSQARSDDGLDDQSILEELAALSDSSEGSRSGERDRTGDESSAGEKAFHLKGKRRTNLHWGSGKRPHKITPQMVLGVFIFSLYMARVPFMLVDVIHAIDSGILPYVDFGRSKYIPTNMRIHLTRELQGASTWARRAPTIEGLHHTLRLLADEIETTFSVRLPDVNAAPILWRLVDGLGGCPAIYLYSVELLRLANLQLSISRPTKISAETKRGHRWKRPSTRQSARNASADDGVSSDSEVEWKDGRSRPKRVGVSAKYAPEAGMAMAVVMALKLAYGLDGKERRIKSPSDPGLGLPTMTAWQTRLRARVASRKGAFEVDIVPKDFIQASEDEMDQFLEQAERALLSHQAVPDGNRLLEELFPVELADRSAGSRRAKAAARTAPILDWQRGHPSATGSDSEEDLQPGEAYELTCPDSSEGQTADLHEFLSAAARLVGIQQAAFNTELARFERQYMTEWRRRALNLRRRSSVAKWRAAGGDADDGMIIEQGS